MNRKKAVKTVVLTLAVLCLLYTADAFFGNPISYSFARRNAESHLKEGYPHLPLRIEEIYHDWYNGGGYDVRVVCDGSLDIRFEMICDRLGRLVWDGYDLTVASGRATLSRLYDTYAELVSGAVATVLPEHICFAGLSSVDEYTGESALLLKGIRMEELTVDGEYDVAAMGTEYGYISLRIVDVPENITMGQAAEYLVRANTALKDHGIGYVYIDFMLLTRDTSDPEQCISIRCVTPADLEGEAIIERLSQLQME